MLENRTVQIVSQTTDSFSAGLNLYRARLDKGYSLTDCISMETMRHEGITDVLTNDAHFEQERPQQANQAGCRQTSAGRLALTLAQEPVRDVPVLVRFANYSGQVGSVIAGFAKLKTMLHNFDERDLTGRQFDNAWSSIRSTLLIFVALYPFAVGGLL